MMGARGKKRQRADGSTATMSGPTSWERAQAAEAAKGPQFIRELLAMGVPLTCLSEVIEDSASRYDLNRKAKGAQIGAFGYTGMNVYRHLFRTGPDYEFDWSTLREGKVTSAGEIGDAIATSRGAVNDAIVRLIDHGFLDRRRCGRSYVFQPLFPRVALLEWAAWEVLQDYPAGTLGHDFAMIAQKVLKGIS